MEESSYQSYIAVDYQIAVKDKSAKKSDTAATTAAADPTTSAAAANTNSDGTALTFATAGLANNPVLQNYVNFQNPTWDTFLFVFFLIAALLYGVSLGRDRIIVILVSIYMSLAVVQAVPAFVLNITLNQNFAFQITAFISVFIVLFFLLSRSALINTLGEGRHRGGIIEVVVFSFLHVGLLISIAMGFLPATFIAKFSALTLTIFTNEWAKFLWIIAPIVAMIVLGKREEED